MLGVLAVAERSRATGATVWTCSRCDLRLGMVYHGATLVEGRNTSALPVKRVCTRCGEANRLLGDRFPPHR